MTETEKEHILIALEMRINYIQTGDVNWSPTTLQYMPERDRPAKIKAINVDQMEAIVEMTKLKTKIQEMHKA